MKMLILIITIAVIIFIGTYVCNANEKNSSTGSDECLSCKIRRYSESMSHFNESKNHVIFGSAPSSSSVSEKSETRTPRSQPHKRLRKFINVSPLSPIESSPVEREHTKTKVPTMRGFMRKYSM